MADPLSAPSLSKLMVQSLEKSQNPQLKTPYEAVALVCHAAMLAIGFKLKGLGEDHSIEATSSATDITPLPSQWNANTTFAFRYSHPQSAMEYIIKIGRLGTRATVDGIAIGADKRTSFDFPIADYISASSLPSTPFTSETDIRQAQQTIQEIFIRPARLTDFGKEFKSRIIQVLAPSLYKEGYVEERSQTAGSARAEEPRHGPANDPMPGRNQPQPARPNPFPYTDPLAAEPRRPFPPGLEPPGFEDEYDILRAPGRGPIPGARNPLNIGEQDLYPPGMGPHDPFGAPFGPGGLPRPGGGGGMHPTFDDPLFGGRGGRGGNPYDPQVPGGARYDPVGPGDPRGGMGSGMRFPGGGGGGQRGGPPNPFGGFGGGDFI